ncbi:lysostaphin resistance A-like protein [Filibacter tadaridae]|uniref:CPBP family intramembrane glutamic endopeptidase n=1 Tax=Filibacter tadaridae TaxID=2483811 RepID=UPI0039E85161
MFANTLYSGTLTGLTIAIVLMTGLYFIALRPKRLSWKEVGVKSFSKKYWRKIPIWLLITIILSVAVLLLTSLLGNSADNSKTESLQQNINLFTILIGIISAGVVSPVYEEIFYRGFIHRWLRVRLGMNWGIVISSLLFTIAHFPTLNAMPVNFINGVMFAWVYEKTGSVIPGMIVHGVFNIIAVLLTVTG